MEESNKKFFVTVLVPVYNEEKAIGPVLDDLEKVMATSGYEYELLMVDDNSQDGTVAEINKKMTVNSRIKLVRRRINGGSGASRKTGILNSRGEVIVMLDGDGTYNAYNIPEMLKYFPEYDQVNGARTSEEGTYKILRFTAKWFIRKIACYLSGYKIPDLNTGLKAFKRDIMIKYLWVIPDGFSCVTTMTLAFLTNGYNVKYIPTKYFKRIGKSKFHPLKDTAKYLNTVVRMVVYFKPLKFFVPLASIIFILGLLKIIFGLYFVEFKIKASDIIIIILAFQLYIFGFLADLIVSTTKRN